MLPGPEGPVEFRDAKGRRVDLFDYIDRLAARHERVLVVDLEGVEHRRPQLDYLQELTRDIEVWIDAGILSGDGIIDVLVTGARRAVVSTGRLRGEPELERALRLSGEVVLEIELEPDGRVRGSPTWPESPESVAEVARTAGVTDLIVSPRAGPVDWELVRTLSKNGNLWVDGSFERAETSRLAPSGAAGAFFHPREDAEEFARSPGPPGGANGEPR